MQNYIRSLIGLAPIVFSGRGFFQYSFGLIPKRLPVTVVGKVLFAYLWFYVHVGSTQLLSNVHIKLLNIIILILYSNFTILFIIVGSPIELPKIAEPTIEQINEYHEKFTKSLVKLFESQKHNYIKNAENITLELWHVFQWYNVDCKFMIALKGSLKRLLLFKNII